MPQFGLAQVIKWPVKTLQQRRRLLINFYFQPWTRHNLRLLILTPNGRGRYQTRKERVGKRYKEMGGGKEMEIGGSEDSIHRGDDEGIGYAREKGNI